MTRSPFAFTVALALVGFWSGECLAGGTFLGAGGTTCAQYAQIRPQFPEIGKGVELWILGYLSGVNFAVYSTKGVDLLADQSRENVLSFIDGYCAMNSTRTLNNAANEYWFQLANRHGR